MNLQRISFLLGTLSICFCCSVSSAQDYTLNHLSHANNALGSPQASSSTSAINGGRLPSELFSDQKESTVVVGNVAEHYRTANYMVLASFAGLLLLGGAITGACIHSNKRMKNATPMTMVNA